MFFSYPLVILHSHGIDGPFIDALPMKNGGSFHGELLNNQRAIAASVSAVPAAAGGAAAPVVINLSKYWVWPIVCTQKLWLG